MNKLQELENKQRELAKQQEELANEIARINNKPVWESVRATYDGNRCWSIYPEGSIHEKISTKECIHLGNEFKTEESAELELLYRKLVVQAKDFIIAAWNEFGEVPDWEDGYQAKYVFYLNDDLVCKHKTFREYHFLHFPNAGSHEEFCEQFTDDDIRLIIKGVW